MTVSPDSGVARPLDPGPYPHLGSLAPGQPNNPNSPNNPSNPSNPNNPSNPSNPNNPDFDLGATVEGRTEAWPVPRGLTATGGEEHVLVRFEPLPGAEEHELAVVRGGTFESQAILERLEPIDGVAVHDDLEPGETYTYAVRARTGDEWTEYSLPATARTQRSSLLRLFIEMDPADVEELYTRDPFSDDQLPARVSLGAPDGPELAVRGLRFRGSGSRFYPKKQLNVRLDERPELEDYPDFNFRDEVRRAGNRLILNAMYTDPTAMREPLSFAMYEELGLPAPRTYYAELYLNDVFEGLYVGIERVDEEALRGWGLAHEDGQFTIVRDRSRDNTDRPEIYRSSIFGADMDRVTASDEEAIAVLQEVLDYRGELEDQNWEALLELVRWAHDVPAGERFAAELPQRFDVDRFIDFLAIHVITHDLDSLDTDFWLYRDETAEDPRWILIPWDKNLTFGAHFYEGYAGTNDFFDYDMAMVSTEGNALFDKFLETPELRERFDARLRELVTERFDDAWYETRIAELGSRIEPAMARARQTGDFDRHPQQHHGEVGFWRPHVASLLDFVRLRRAYVLEQLDGGGEDEGRYVAELRLERLEGGELVPLVDAEGWVVVELRPRVELGQATTIEARVAEGAEAAVDRVWTLRSTGRVEGDWSFYYRNTPDESWYRELTTAGEQWYLDAFVERDGAREPVRAAVNPLSNRVTVPLTLDAGEEVRVVLDLER